MSKRKYLSLYPDVDAMDTDEKNPKKVMASYAKPAHMKGAKRSKEKITVSNIFKEVTKSGIFYSVFFVLHFRKLSNDRICIFY